MTDRKFPIGSRWTYLKLYSGPQMLEAILTNEFYDFVNRLLTQKLIEKFFFIRYSDDGHHLRVRFQIAEHYSFDIFFDELNKVVNKLTKNKLAHNSTYNTYSRELERYGIENIEECETIFYFSSITVMGMLKQHNNAPTEHYRWLWACNSINMLLEKFQLTIESKSAIMSEMVRVYSMEYNLTKYAIRTLNDKYRKHFNQIEAMFKQDDTNSVVTEELKVLYTNAITKILTRHERKILTPSLTSILISLIHMHLNRIFSTQQRQSEFVLCYFLDKYYISQIARKSSKEKINTNVTEYSPKTI